jgi:hypothetical protein
MVFEALPPVGGLSTWCNFPVVGHGGGSQIRFVHQKTGCFVASKPSSNRRFLPI